MFRPGGSQLDFPARILLQNVFPSKSKHPNVDRYRKKIEKKTAKFGTFIRYDPDRGEWEFKVKGFGD